MPPVYVQPAGDAIVALGRSLARQLSDTADGLREGWTEESARKWMNAAWHLDQPIAQARTALNHAEDSLRLNPRQRRVGQADGSLRNGLSALEHAAITIRGLMTSLVDRVRGIEEAQMPSEEVRLALADVLDEHAAAVRTFAELVGADVSAPWRTEASLDTALNRARNRPEVLVERLAVDAHDQPGLWQVHGALLANLDRLLHEVDPQQGTQAAGARRDSAAIEPWVAAMRRVARQRSSPVARRRSGS
jgi:hypothetical protein